MDSLTYLIFGVGLLILWLAYCNSKTYRQRTAIIEVIFYELDGSPVENYRQFCIWFRMVTYDEHLRALILFRDPFKLYDGRLIARLGVA